MFCLVAEEIEGNPSSDTADGVLAAKGVRTEGLGFEDFGLAGLLVERDGFIGVTSRHDVLRS
ncbi:MAG: hypothetical protein ACOC2Q_02630, partial [Spirochaetota bacterium]